MISVKIGEEDTAVGSSVGMWQGACEGPILFPFIMQAALEATKRPVAKPTFLTRADGVTTGGGFNRKRGAASFELFVSLFAGGFAIFFEAI